MQSDKSKPEENKVPLDVQGNDPNTKSPEASGIDTQLGPLSEPPPTPEKPEKWDLCTLPTLQKDTGIAHGELPKDGTAGKLPRESPIDRTLTLAAYAISMKHPDDTPYKIEKGIAPPFRRKGRAPVVQNAIKQMALMDSVVIKPAKAPSFLRAAHKLGMKGKVGYDDQGVFRFWRTR